MKLGAYVLGVMFCFTAVVCYGQYDAPSEYDVKAAFVLNFLKFTDFPAENTGSGDNPLVLCVYRGKRAAEHFNSLGGKQVKGEMILVRKVDLPNELGVCRAIFVPRGYSSEFYPYYPLLKGKPVLLIGEKADFCRSGGMISFFIENRRVRFEINKSNAEISRIKISSNLLKLARLVE